MDEGGAGREGEALALEDGGNVGALRGDPVGRDARRAGADGRRGDVCMKRMTSLSEE